MKKIKGYVTLLMAAVIILSAVGCSRKETAYSESAEPGYTSAKSDQPYYGDSAGSSAGYSYEISRDAAAPETNASTANLSMKSNGSIRNASTITSSVPDAGTMEKIIRNINMEIETQDFDELITAINEEIKRLDGYVESSSISGKSYHSLYELRRGHIVARIPKDRLDEFVGLVSDASNVVNKSESTENVTLQYVDTESHIKALEMEQEKLYELLGKTGTLEDILTLESRLSTIRYELENYKSQLRLYDNKVEYGTVTLNVQEVERITPKKEVKDTVFTRIKKGLSDTMYNISEGFKDMVVGIAVNIPYILFWILVLLICYLLIRRAYKKYKRRKMQENIACTRDIESDSQAGKQDKNQKDSQ